MKKFEFNINEGMKNNLFVPIRNKSDVIRVLMHSIKIMLIVPKPIRKPSIDDSIILLVDKMSRLFYFSENKYYSIGFPFIVDDNSEQIKFFLKNNKIEIDSDMASKILSIIDCHQTLNANCSLDFIEKIEEYEQNSNIWMVFKELIFFEDGYIRYDYDEENYNKALQSNKCKLHPLNHIDIFYSSNCTFKIGMDAKINNENFRDMMDTATDCYFIK